MFESEHQYSALKIKYLRVGAMVGNGAIVPRAWVCSHNLLHTLQAIKTASGSRNKAARVGMLTLLQNEIGYFHSQIDSN